MEIPKTLFTIATGSRLGAHTTCIAATIEQLIQEVDSTLACDEQMLREIIEEYNETATAMNRPLYQGLDSDFSFAFIVKNDPRTDMGGWGWAWEWVDSLGRDDNAYLNISVHVWTGHYFNTEG